MKSIKKNSHSMSIKVNQRKAKKRLVHFRQKQQKSGKNELKNGEIGPRWPGRQQHSVEHACGADPRRLESVGEEHIPENRKAANFLNLMKNNNTEIQDSQQTPNSIKTKKAPAGHIIDKRLRVKNKEKILKTTRQKYYI